MALLPMPRFHDDARVSQLYLERAAEVAEEARRYAAEHRIRPAREDAVRIAAFGIDAQVAFCTPGASLFVPGAVEDTQRTLRWLHGHLDRLTALVFSLDTHRAFQIFHPAWWRDARGLPPPALTVITADAVRSGVWTATRHPEESLAYCERLEASGRYVLTIWPYHALLGGQSHGLVPAMYEASLFHALVRDTPTHFELKGEHPLTENYSVLAPEVTEVRGQKVGEFNTRLFEHLMSFERVYVFGQAKSHCVLSTLRDLQQHIEQTDPSKMGRIHILEDAMSPVPAPPLEPLPPALDFPRVADAAVRDFARAGMRVVRTTDSLDL
ncbi:nicotinamidase [Corallococcus sp. H22C18031201]|uniref:nicotinamidase n=1 Tax=Citreicoccus inhibens TaxID=2849499 RepID=UPI000E770CA6|nr:nicotinamidase [Citreicoccus inhibens]MBU8897736.1 nicotinamidase [Citreicoccus inhibens]RJS27503.1 nicotinamidase [Corallococcus sp. H22C18031201]